jgi:hypothetical protein
MTPVPTETLSSSWTITVTTDGFTRW